MHQAHRTTGVCASLLHHRRQGHAPTGVWQPTGHQGQLSQIRHLHDAPANPKRRQRHHAFAPAHVPARRTAGIRLRPSVSV